MRVKELIDQIDAEIPMAYQGKFIPDAVRFSIDVIVVGNMALEGVRTIIKNVSYDHIDDAIIIEVGSEV